MLWRWDDKRIRGVGSNSQKHCVAHTGMSTPTCTLVRRRNVSENMSESDTLADTTHFTRGDFSCSFMHFLVHLASHGPTNLEKQGLIQKRFPIFGHFGRLWFPKSDLSVGQAGANCETFWRVKCMFTLRHIIPHAIFRLKSTHFSMRPSREALTPKTKPGLIVKPFGACHPKNTGAN